MCVYLGQCGGSIRDLRPHRRGGLSSVFVALDTELNREVAVGQMRDQYADDPDSRWRLSLIETGDPSKRNG